MKLRRLLKLTPALLAGASFAASAALPTVASPAEPVRSFAATSLLQAGLGLAVVIGLIFLFAWVVRRFGLQPSGSGRLLKVVSSVMVGQRERVVVVQVGESWLVLGVAAGQVRALHTMPAEKLPDVQAPGIGGLSGFGSGSGSAFSQKLLDSLNKIAKPKRD